MENFLTNIAKANENVANIENQLFDVVMKPLMVADPEFIVEDEFGVFKSTGGKKLGSVGNRFAPTQPRAVFQAFCDAILDKGLDTAKMRYTEVKGGQVVRFSIDLEPISYVNLRKKVLSTGKISLYLDFYPPIINPKTGKETRREFLKLYLFMAELMD
jgi:hypothetical protein